MELLACIVLASVVIIQFIGLVVVYQLLTKNTNEQIKRQTEYLEGIYTL